MSRGTSCAEQATLLHLFHNDHIHIANHHHIHIANHHNTCNFKLIAAFRRTMSSSKYADIVVDVKDGIGTIKVTSA